MILVRSNHSIKDMVICTEKGRKPTVGWIDQKPLQHHNSDDTRSLVGICGRWWKSTIHGTYPDWLAAAVLPHPAKLRPTARLDVDVQASLQRNAPLPSWWKAHGPVLGIKTFRAEPLTYLDLSRSSRRIEVCLEHRGLGHNVVTSLPLLSMILTYSNGSIASIGPTELDSETDTNGLDDSVWWVCYICQSDKPSKPAAKLSYYLQSWSLDQQKIRFWQLWKEATSFTVIQFIAEDDTKGPRWGKCMEAPTSIISFGGEDNIVGLGSFVGTNECKRHPLEMIVIALQNLTEENSTTTLAGHVIQHQNISDKGDVPRFSLKLSSNHFSVSFP